MADAVDTSMEHHQAPRLDAAIDGSEGESEIDELRAGDNAALSGRECREVNVERNGFGRVCLTSTADSAVNVDRDGCGGG